MSPRVLIVGRPNVGKSSLFNALTGHRISIVSEEANTTRDTIEYPMDDAERGVSYTIIDSGGVNIGSDNMILQDVRRRVEAEMRQADIIVLVVEYDRLTTVDDELIRLIRRTGRPAILVANKADNPSKVLEANALYGVGFEKMVIMSVAHRMGTGALLDTVAAMLKEKGHSRQEFEESTDLKVAIIGRPNVGKSSIVNALVGGERMLVQDEAGTTRDSIDSPVVVDGENIILIDTAGMRRPGRIGIENIESWSVLRTVRAIERADIVAIVLDASERVSHLDKTIVGQAVEANKGIILIANKWDRYLKGLPPGSTDDPEASYLRYLKHQFEFLSYALPVYTTAVTGEGVEEILKTALHIRDERMKRVKTAAFNAFIADITLQHAPTGTRKSHKPRIYYGSQVDTNPPKFVLSVNNAEHFHFSYHRYIENRIREVFGFYGTPITLELRSRESIYKNKTPKEEKHRREKKRTKSEFKR